MEYNCFTMCVSFCFITKWISYTYTYVPISLPSCASLPPSCVNKFNYKNCNEMITFCTRLLINLGLLCFPVEPARIYGCISYIDSIWEQNTKINEKKLGNISSCFIYYTLYAQMLVLSGEYTTNKNNNSRVHIFPIQ